MFSACSLPVTDFALILLSLVFLGLGAGVMVGLQIANMTLSEWRKT